MSKKPLELNAAAAPVTPVAAPPVLPQEVTQPEPQVRVFRKPVVVIEDLPPPVQVGVVEAVKEVQEVKGPYLSPRTLAEMAVGKQSIGNY